jgi:hypothetical protein
MRHHSAGAPALLTPLQRADNLVVNTMNRQGRDALVFVRFAHDRRFVGAVLFLFVLVIFVFKLVGDVAPVASARPKALA